MEDAGGVAAPGDLAQLVIGEFSDPDVAAPGREGDATVLEEVDSADANPGLVRIFCGDVKVVDEVRRVEDFSELVVQGLFRRGFGFALDLAFDGFGLFGLVDFSEGAFGLNGLGPVGGATLGELAQVFGSADTIDRLGQGGDVLRRAVSEGNLE